MATVNQSIEVDVPVSVAYNQWTQFESFPEFMDGVEAVEQIDDTALHFTTNLSGIKSEFTAQILDQVPDTLISWASTDGPRNSGEVRFEPLDDNRTGVSVHIEWEPETLKEKIGAVLRADDLQVSVDLERFKKFIEHRGRETGTWRGAVSGGDVEDGRPASTDYLDTGSEPAAAVPGTDDDTSASIENVARPFDKL